MGRITLVSAIKQSLAVEKLFDDYKMQAGKDYEPQYAQEVALSLSSVISSSKESNVPSPSAPPPLYPIVSPSSSSEEDPHNMKMT